MIPAANRQCWSLPERKVSHVLQLGTLLDGVPLLNLELRGEVEQSVTVSALDAVSCLSPDPSVTFIHRSRVLSPALSFRFLQIQDGDEIFIVHKGHQNECKSVQSSVGGMTCRALGRLREQFDARFALRFKDPDETFEQLRAASDQVTARESARLTDLYKMRVEGRHPGALLKVKERLQEMPQRKPWSIQEPTVLPEKALTPSTELLPDFWRAQPGSFPFG
jgi:hypothetical protein